MKKIYVFSWNGSDRLAGSLEFVDDWRIEYEPIDESVEISPLIDANGSRRTILDGFAFDVFADSAPDYWGRLVMAAALRRDISDIRLSTCLLWPFPMRFGNLDFRENPGGRERPFELPGFARLEELCDAAAKIEEGNESRVDKRLFPMLMQGSSLGGARPKCVIEYKGELWIAKFPSIRDRWSNARIELAAHRLAKACGVETPDCEIVEIGSKDVFLSRRFDREKSGNGWKRKCCVSGLTVLGLAETDYPAFSYAGLAAKSDGAEIFRRMAFNVIIRNTDDHPRNHAFFWKNGVLSPTPAYDLVPTEAREGLSSVPSHAMRMGSFGREGSAENLFSETERFGLSQEEAQTIFAAMVEKTSSWPEMMAKARLREKDAERFIWPVHGRWENLDLDETGFPSP